MAAKRVTRPKLERDRPRREWSTLFGAAPKTKDASPERPAAGKPARPGEGAALSDTVELGYRVIEDYVKQGQQAAQAFASQNWPGGAGGGAGGVPGSAGDMQQMAQRVMQYGWDFAGLWFEMWTRMGGPSGMPPMPGSHPHSHAAAGPAGAEVNGAAAPSADAAASETLSVSVESALPTTTSIELRPGRHGELVVHALRPEGHEGLPIKGVTLERSAEDGSLVVNVVVDAGQKPGTYRAAIVAAATNKAVGTLSVRVQAKKR